MKKLRQINAKQPNDPVNDVVSQIDKTGPNNFISQSVSNLEEKTGQVKCKEGQYEVFDNCIRDDSISKEQQED